MRIPIDGTVDMATPVNQPRLLHAGDAWLGKEHPHVLIKDDSLRLMGSLETGVAIDPDFGTLIQGKMSFSESPDNISFSGGYWRINPLELASIGSSAAMPVPFLVPSTPELLQGGHALASLADSVGA